MATENWDTVYTSLRESLEGETTAAQVIVNFGADYESFEADINALYTRYVSKAEIIQTKIAPLFSHIRSFEKAVAAATSNSQAAGFIWAGVFVILECVCRFSAQVENTLDQIANFYKTIPLFEEYIDIFPNDKRLEKVLQDVYEDYGQFCALLIKYTLKRPMRNTIENIWSSKAPKKLRQVESSLAKHKQEFETYTKLAFRKHVVPPSTRNPPRPPPNTVRRRHIKYFSGQNVLVDLHKQIQDSRPSFPSEPISCVLHGMGGIGKTQLAVEYNFKYEKEYGCRFWVAAENPTSLRESYNQIAAQLFDVQPIPQEVVGKVRDWLESTKSRWLLILDNVEDWESVKHFVPNASRSRSVIIMTSQVEGLQHWTTSEFEVKSLDTDVGADLLLKIVWPGVQPPENERDSARYLSEMFGGLPLALAHIGGYVSQHTSLSKYRDLADRRFASAWKGYPSTVHEYEKRLESVFDIALSELAQASPTARNLIDIMAFLNPDSIPEEMLMMNLQKNTIADQDSRPEDEFLEMAPNLVKRGLVHREEAENGNTSFSIHRTLQHALLLKLDEGPKDQRNEVFKQASSIVRQVLPQTSPTQTPDESLWPQLERTVPHVLRICRIFIATSPQTLPGSFELARMFYDAGFHTWEQWNPSTQDGIMFLTTAENILQGLDYDTNGKLQADIHSIMGMFLDQIGISQRMAAVDRRKKAMLIRKNLLDLAIKHHQLDPMRPLDSDTELLFYNATNDEGRSLLQSNIFKEAGEAFELCYAKYKKWGTEDTIPFEYGKYYHNMSYVHMYNGNFPEALELATRGVNLTERKGRSGRYWWFRYDLACIELQSGDLAKALSSHLEILENRKKVCGPDSEMAIESYYTVGAMYHHLNNLPLAEENIREAIQRAGKGRWHKEALGRAQLHLARIIRQRKGDLDEAAKFEVEARGLLEQYLKVDHPEYLKGDKDELAIFDNMQPVFEGRFTGRLLLKYIQDYHRDQNQARVIKPGDPGL